MSTQSNFFKFNFFKSNNNAEDRVEPFDPVNKTDLINKIKYEHFCLKYNIRKSLTLIFGSTYITYPIVSFRKITQEYFCQIYIDYLKCVNGPRLDPIDTLDYIQFLALHKAVDHDFYLHQWDIIATFIGAPRISLFATLTHYFQ
jgi:hypothetical protein